MPTYYTKRAVDLALSLAIRDDDSTAAADEIPAGQSKFFIATFVLLPTYNTYVLT